MNIYQLAYLLYCWILEMVFVSNVLDYKPIGLDMRKALDVLMDARGFFDQTYRLTIIRLSCYDRKINAIKLLRTILGAAGLENGLKTCKEIMDEVHKSQIGIVIYRGDALTITKILAAHTKHRSEAAEFTFGIEEV